MAKKKSKLDLAVAATAGLIEKHLEKLSYDEGKAMMADIHALAAKPSRASSRGRASRSRKTLRPRLSRRASAKRA